VYYFTEIPSKVDPARAALVGAMGVAFSLLGAVIPALRAAMLHPVRALRFE
jgi:lipoprotein-releasing system permease protein